MEYNIYDLMDEFADENIALSPCGTADLRRIEELTMKRIEEQTPARRAKRAVRRVTRTVLVAAIVAALCGVTVVAAKLGVADSFKGYFGDLTAEQKQVMEELGTTDMQPVTSNGTTITPLAAICDENNYYLRLRIEAPEGTELYDYREGEGNMQLWDSANDIFTFFTCDEYDAMGMCIDCDWFDETPGDNVLEVVVRIIGQYMDSRVMAELKKTEGEDVTVLSFTDGKPKQINIHNLWWKPWNTDLPYEVLLEGDWSFEIGRNAKPSPTVYVDASGRTTESVWSEPGYPLTLEYFRISPLSVVGEYSYPYDERIAEGSCDGYGVTNFALVMKDGSTLELGTGGGGTTGWDFASLNCRFDAPIDVTQVDHIVFGDQIIPVLQTAE